MISIDKRKNGGFSVVFGLSRANQQFAPMHPQYEWLHSVNLDSNFDESHVPSA